MKTSNDINRETYKPGTKIYYTGDMANIEDFGIITKFHEPTKYAPQRMDIELNDGRVFPQIYCSNLQLGPGRRFWLADDWKKDQKEKMDSFINRMKH